MLLLWFDTIVPLKPEMGFKKPPKNELHILTKKSQLSLS